MRNSPNFRQVAQCGRQPPIGGMPPPAPMLNPSGGNSSGFPGRGHFIDRRRVQLARLGDERAQPGRAGAASRVASHPLPLLLSNPDHSLDAELTRGPSHAIAPI
jgi:hypothetical protein